MSRFFFIIIIICSITRSIVCGTDTHIKERDIFELKLTAGKTYKNPYTEGLPDYGNCLVSVTFDGNTGEAAGKKYIISGFWDGGQSWLIRFSPPAPGKWTYISRSSDPRMNGIRGSFICDGWSEAEKNENPVRRGFIRVCKTGERAGRYFEYSDGTPFLWIGDTWWNWSKKDIEFSSFRSLVDNRVSKGFTIGQLWVPGNSGQKSSALDRTYDTLYVDQIKRIEERIAYANSKGMTVWIHGWWARENLSRTASPEKIKRWCRYLINRFGAYNVVWVLCGEYTLYDYSGFGIDFWKELGKLIKMEDPYERIVSLHPNPSIYIFPDSTQTAYYSTGDLLHGEPWLDYNQIQSGHSKWRNEMIPPTVIADYDRKPHKPVVVTEPWYEFMQGDPAGDWTNKAHSNITEEIIFGAWTAFLSGAAGHSYGGGQVWWAHLPESPERSGGDWSLWEKDFDNSTMDYPGAVAIGNMARFLKTLKWWEFEPHPELVSGYSSRFCSSVPGKEYLIFMRYGGGIKLDLFPSLPGETFSYEWFDPRTGEILEGGTVKGGKSQNFIAPGNLPDSRYMWKPVSWILHVWKTGS